MYMYVTSDLEFLNGLELAWGGLTFSVPSTTHIVEVYRGWVGRKREGDGKRGGRREEGWREEKIGEGGREGGRE